MATKKREEEPKKEDEEDSENYEDPCWYGYGVGEFGDDPRRKILPEPKSKPRTESKSKIAGCGRVDDPDDDEGWSKIDAMIEEDMSAPLEVLDRKGCEERDREARAGYESAALLGATTGKTYDQNDFLRRALRGEGRDEKEQEVSALRTLLENTYPGLSPGATPRAPAQDSDKEQDPLPTTRRSPRAAPTNTKEVEEVSNTQHGQFFFPPHAAGDKKGLKSSLPQACATHLWDSLLLARSVNPRRSQVNKWTEDFSKLLNDVMERLEIPESEAWPHIVGVLEWYCSVISDPFTPDARSGQKFREKFIQMEHAFSRAQEVTRRDLEEHDRKYGCPEPSAYVSLQAFQRAYSSYHERQAHRQHVLDTTFDD